ncbi:MAG: trypsin-like peptidase domain-containing protein [Clostridia bacterium]
MYNHYPNNNQDNGVNPQNTSGQNTEQTNYQYSQNQTYNNQEQPWNGQSVTTVPQPPQPPVYSSYTPQIPKKVKKTKVKKPIGGLKIAFIVILSVVLSSGCSVALFSGMINSGFITISSSGTTNSSDTDSLAFTIAKVVDDSDDEETLSEVSVLSTQDIAETVVPSVVCIQNYQIDESYSMFGEIIGSSDSSEISPASEGSGIIMSEDGYIITNAHVVEDATDLKVVLYDGTTLEATIIGTDTTTDVAVIKVEVEEGVELTVAEFGSSSDLVVGDDVVAIGNPGGLALSSTVTTGIVSAVDREITVDGYTMYLIQTDAAISPGNSGGALVNEYGQVVGINSLKYADDGYEGLGFAIPIDTAQEIVSDLINYGYVTDRAVIGISGTYVDETTARFYGLSTGVYVAETTTDYAVESGLTVGDVITYIDGEQVTSFDVITNRLLNLTAGDTVTLIVDRVITGETDIEITLVLSEYVETTVVEEETVEQEPETQTTPDQSSNSQTVPSR